MCQSDPQSGSSCTASPLIAQHLPAINGASSLQLYLVLVLVMACIIGSVALHSPFPKSTLCEPIQV